MSIARNIINVLNEVKKTQENPDGYTLVQFENGKNYIGWDESGDEIRLHVVKRLGKTITAEIEQEIDDEISKETKKMNISLTVNDYKKQTVEWITTRDGASVSADQPMVIVGKPMRR